MAHLASLVEFLNSGKLGPLHPGVGVKQVIDLLGPPQRWAATEEWHFRPIPTYWVYGRLELQLNFGTEPRCDWFQLEHISSLTGDVDVITDNLTISLDGLDGNSKLSDVIKTIRDPSSICIHLADASGYLHPTVFVGSHIEFGFGISKDDVIPGEPRGTLCKRIDQDCVPVDIYSVGNNTVSQEYGAKVLGEKGLRDLILSGSEYLRMIE